MKSPIMLVCALVAAMGMSAMAEEAAAAAKAPAKAEHKQMTAEEREAMVTKRLEAIKAKDEALYKELVALKEKDPEAFKAKMREMGKAAHAKGEGKHKKAKGADAAAK